MTDQTSDRSAAYSEEEAAAHASIVSKSLGQQQRSAPMGTVLDVLNQGYEIIRQVAASVPVVAVTSYSGRAIDWRCIYGCGGQRTEDEAGYHHSPRCAYILAKDLMERHAGEGGGGEGA